MKSIISMLVLTLTISVNVSNAIVEHDQRLLFENISNLDGLSHSTVFSIIQDSTGYLWFGTQDGLNRYDGYEFKVFRPEASRDNSIISSYIRSLLIDNAGTLWIGGNHGISRYNYQNESFDNYPLFTTTVDRYISCITQDCKGNIWATSLNGDFYKYEIEENTFAKIQLIVGEKPDHISSVLPIENALLLGTDYGIFHLNTDSLSITKIELPEIVKVRAILPDVEVGYWIGTEGDGLMKVNIDFEVVKHLKHNRFNDNSLCNDNVRSLKWDNSGKMWIGTFVGLSIYDQESNTFSNYYEEFGQAYSLSQNSVRSIFKDNLGGMWLGTFFGGVNYYHPANIKFNLLNQNGGNYSLNDNVISAIKEDSKGNFWICTNDKGLNYWDRESNCFKYYEHNERAPNTLSSNNLKSVIVLDNGHLLVGTHNSGLNYFAPERDKNKVFQSSKNPESISSNQIYALLKDHKGMIWVGTWKGLDRFDEKSHRFYHHYFDSKGKRLTSDQISFLYEDSRNRIWVGTFEGLNIFHPGKNLFESFKNIPGDSASLANNEITCITEDSKGRIWIGTKNGLNLFDELNREFVRYGMEEGLPNNIIYGIIEDDEGSLWISSNGGLSNFHPKTKKVKNYTPNDGIQGMQFNNYAFCKSSGGQLLFGGINGITFFDPRMMINTPFNSKVIITQFGLFNNWIKVGDKSGILSKHISNTSRVVLDHNQNAISLQFSALNYIASNNIGYKYMLEGFDNNWQLASRSRSAAYSNLSPGEYLFKVKAVSSDGKEGDSVNTLAITIKHPWWLTPWAIIIYSFIVAGVGWIAYRLVKERIRTQNQLKIERLEKQKLTEINQMKLQFFTNISHEFRTPLTLIISPLQKIRELRFNDEWLIKQQDIIYKNAKRLLNLIDQLMDFRKSELGTLRLKAGKGEFISFINEIYLSFAEVASRNNIIYTFDTREEKLEIWFDKNYMEKIAFNLLSNAFKFTPLNGTIGIQLYKSGQWAILEVSDSGKGIPIDKQSLIFERFYQIDESSQRPGSGIGLALTKRLVELHHGKIEVESEKGKGATFKVSIPLKKDVYGDNEILIEEQGYEHIVTEPLIDCWEKKEAVFEEEAEEIADSILIVEDNRDIVRYVRENLSGKFKIIEAGNGEEALKIVNTDQPSLIISDIMMPVLDGIRFCRKIKQNIKTCHIPIILLTAKSSIENQIEGMEIGADDYITKPFSMNLLEAKISNLIKTRKRLKEYYSKSLDIQPDSIAFNSLDKELLNKAVAIIEENLSDSNLSVDFFAREMGMSRSNLHLKLKAVTGESATDFIKKIRFGKATKLLEENKYSIAEVSYMVGFNSPSYFSTSFKKYFGYLPTDYLQKRNENR